MAPTTTTSRARAAVLREPRDGVPSRSRPRASSPGLVDAPGRRHGPVAIDAERASGYRYSQRAYLVQLRRAGAGTGADRPDRAARPAVGQRGYRRRRVDPARCRPGPALPGRGRAGARPAVRHRARRPAARRRAGRARHDGRAAPRRRGWRRGIRRPTGPPGRCRTTGWSTPPWTSSCWSRCATSLAAQLAAAGQDRVGRSRSSRRSGSPPAAPPRQDPWRRTSGIHKLRDPAPAGHGALAVDGPRPATRRAATSLRAGCCPTRRSSRRPRGRTRLDRPTWPSCRYSAGRASAAELDRWFAALEAARGLPDGELPLARHIPGGDGMPRHRPLERPRPRGRAAGLARADASWPACRRSTPCWRRTCSPPTWFAGWPGGHRSRPRRAPCATACASSAHGRGRSS